MGGEEARGHNSEISHDRLVRGRENKLHMIQCSLKLEKFTHAHTVGGGMKKRKKKECRRLFIVNSRHDIFTILSP